MRWRWRLLPPPRWSDCWSIPDEDVVHALSFELGAALLSRMIVRLPWIRWPTDFVNPDAAPWPSLRSSFSYCRVSVSPNVVGAVPRMVKRGATNVPFQLVRSRLAALRACPLPHCSSSWSLPGSSQLRFAQECDALQAH